MSRRAMLVATLLVAVSGCGAATLRQSEGGTPSFDAGKAAFDRKDWVEAALHFKAYVEQYPGTDRTDDALYHLGVSYFQTKEYALASSQFDRLTRDFPQSPFLGDASFYLARCDDLESRPAPLDQTETLRAIDRYRQFLDAFPDHPRAGEARERMQRLRERLAEKRFRNGRLYSKLDQNAAAALYLRGVIDEFGDTRWSGEAALLLADVLIEDGKRADAAAVLQKMPDGATPEAKERARAKLRSIGAAPSP